MSYTQEFTEVHDVLATLAPVAANSAVGAHSTGYVSLADYHRAFVFMQAGVPALGATLDLALWEAQDTAGTGAQAIAGKAITQFTAADTGEYVGIELRTPELDVTNNYNCVAAIATVGTGTYTYELVLFGIVARYEPAGITDFAEVVH